MDVAPLNVVCVCILSLLVDAMTMGSKNITVDPDLLIIKDHDRSEECDLNNNNNSTIISVCIDYNLTKQAEGGGRLMESLSGRGGRLLRGVNESRWGEGGGGRLLIGWESEEQKGTEADPTGKQCHINTQLNLKFTNETGDYGGLGWIVTDATLVLETSTPDHSHEEMAKVPLNGRGSNEQVYRCTCIRQMSALSDGVDIRQVATEIYCGSINWRRIQIQLRIENRTEESFSSSSIQWSNYEMTCDLVKTQTTDTSDEKRAPLFQPNPSTIYVATAFGVVLLCIVVGYFVVKNRRQAASYATISDE